MLFRKKIARQCVYCKYAAKANAQQMVCVKKGLVPATGACGRFCYDPLKRVPPRPAPLDFDRWKEEDFTL